MTERRKGPLYDAWPEIELNGKRREAAEVRLDTYRGDFADCVRRMVSERIRDKESAAEVSKFVNAAHNLTGSVVDLVNVAYRSGVRRSLRGADEATAQAFADLVTESGLPESATMLSALAWIAGPVALLPYVDTVRGVSRLCIDIVTPDRFEVKRSASAPDVLDAVLVFREDGTFAQLDAGAWRYFDADGYPLDGGAHDKPHGAGFCPAVVFRSRERLPIDWWNACDHAGLIAGTHEIAFLHALGRWTRAQTSTPLTVVYCNDDDKIPRLQALGHPTRPLVVRGSRGEVEVDVKDRRTDPAQYLAEIGALAAACVQRYGVPPAAVTMVANNAEWGSIAIAMTPGALAVQRDKATPWLRASERALWTSIAAVVRASGHRHARALPEAEAFEDMLRVAFPDLRDPGEQIKRTAALKDRLPLGLASLTGEIMEARPEVPEAEAAEELADNLKTYVETIKPLVERNVPADPGPARGVETPMQVNGRTGGIASGEARAAGSP